ncbi:hypothetical protein LL962_16030 [Xanthomonas sp. NCPPB 1067]|uniref:hypothetical protein n=1 Tax=Xanthomonas TaxID=338 RepID=UPI001E54365E|nr:MULTISPECIES: hypothetical protein [Xanthomonas]MCC4588592.1 hypothetical protein [Xanthomonas sp. NCPPB 1067]MCD0246025.1 hypothetical protein [Xanthomonas melonis]
MSAVPTLPPPLQTWQLWLEWFDPEIAAQLGAWLLRLDPLLGHAELRRIEADAEPDGVDDLRRRGSYTHLLLSEWALADAAPDEFLRRAAHDEHLFLVPRLQTRSGDARLVAIFDAGPAQWGAPRLAHVALWILLARRAQGANARLAWGLAHVPGTLHDADDVAQLQRLLQGRTFEATCATHAQAWATQLAAETPIASECWWIGAQPVQAAPFRHQACIVQAADGQLQIALQTRRATRAVQLPVPASAAAARLLRGHFTQAHRPTDLAHQLVRGKFSLRHPPLFSPDGSHVAVLLADGCRSAMVKVQSGDATNQAPPRYHDWAQGSQLLCLAAHNKRVGGIVAQQGQALFWNLKGMTGRAASGELDICPAPGQTRLWPCVWLKDGGQPHRFLLCDRHGRLLSWNSGAGRRHDTGPGSEIARQVLALAHCDARHALYATHADGLLQVIRLDRDGRQETILQTPSPSRPPGLLFRSLLQDGQWHGAIAFERVQHRAGGDRSLVYRLHVGGPADGFRESEVILASGERPVGLVADPQDPRGSLLLLLSADRRALVTIGERGRQTLHRASSDISAAAISIDGERIALINLQGQLRVLADGGQTPVMMVQGQTEHLRDG